MSRKYSITKKQSDVLYETIKYIHDIFIANNIAYWVSFGSLLGAIRHRGIIPWDDDGDVCILKKDVPKLRRLVKQFVKDGYIIEEGIHSEGKGPHTCTKRKNSCTWFIIPDDPNGLGVDLFVMERIGPIVTFSDPEWRDADSGGGKTCFTLYKYLFPLVPVRFGNFFVMTPFNSIEHLNSCYGPDWNTMAQRLFDHRTGKWIMSKKHRMSALDYDIIPPPKKTCDSKVPDMPCLKRVSSLVKEKSEKLTDQEVRAIAKMLEIKGPNLAKKVEAYY